jgi:hypothetical protein
MRIREHCFGIWKERNGTLIGDGLRRGNDIGEGNEFDIAQLVYRADMTRADDASANQSKP